MTEQNKNNSIVLLVEDEIPLLKAIELKLKSNGFSVKKARTVDEAINHLESEEFNVIWLDHYLLGKESGLDLVEKIKKENSPWSDIPIFLVSNTASPEKIKSYESLGINKTYVKAENRLDEIIEDIKEEL